MILPIKDIAAPGCIAAEALPDVPQLRRQPLLEPLMPDDGSQPNKATQTRIPSWGGDLSHQA